MTRIHWPVNDFRAFRQLPPLLVFVAGLLANPATLDAQSGTLQGSVLSAASARPIPGATVIVLGTGREAMTDSAGYFRIAELSVGRYEVEARFSGRSGTRAIASVRDGQTTDVRIVLAEAPVELVGVTVVGRRADALSRLPGSASVVTSAQIAAQQPLSANDVLRRVPGLHIQEEEGAGLRANIGIRGLDPDRSRTVLILEDGVPVALAPYGEPEMYYSPPIERMERLEIVKGSGSILFGPQTIGGVINYVTADAPAEPEGRLQAQGGTGASRLYDLQYGGTWGNTGASGSVLRKSADDWNGLFYDVTDVTGKVGFRTGRGDFGVKLSVYDERSNSTYVGLTDSLYRARPHVHPAPNDELAIRRYAVTGTHLLDHGATSVRTNVYAYQTVRDWRRQNYTYSSTGSTILLQDATGNRNRAFEVAGVEPRLRTIWMAGALVGELEAGVRAHVERVRDQHIDGATATSSTGTIRDDEVRTGRAIAAFVQNRLSVTASFHVTPGIRYERLEFDRHILRTRVRRTSGATTTRLPEDVDVRTSDALAEVIPGIGTAWSPTQLVTVFAGAHRGFAPPRTKDALIYEDPTLAPDEQVPVPVSLQLDAERSWNYELGLRLMPASFLSVEATAFRLDFSNQIIEPSLSAGSVSQAQLANQGETRHTGVEIGAALDIGKLLRRPFGLTAEVAYTYVDAVFARERLIERAPDDTVDVNGNRLPYAPRHKATGSLTFRSEWGLLLRLDGTYVGEQFSDNFETVASSPNGRVGLIPAHRVFDFSAQYRLPRIESLTLTGSVKNLADDLYITSRRPEGIKPGLPRLLTFGLIWEM